MTLTHRSSDNSTGTTNTYMSAGRLGGVLKKPCIALQIAIPRAIIHGRILFVPLCVELKRKLEKRTNHAQQNLVSPGALNCGRFPCVASLSHAHTLKGNTHHGHACFKLNCSTPPSSRAIKYTLILERKPLQTSLGRWPKPGHQVRIHPASGYAWVLRVGGG